uniref:Putative ixostatin n=1 Tax=Ixodes ricinus TaxID=34613 RepID=A0A0K8RJD8_IXORI
MQLTLFVVIVTFSHLSCEVQSEPIPDILEEMKDLTEGCKNSLKEQMKERCGKHPYQPHLKEVKDCAIICGDWHNNGQTWGITRQTINLKNGTPCGYNKK